VKSVHFLPVLISALLYLFCIDANPTDANPAPTSAPSRLQVYKTYAPAKVIRNYISPLLKGSETISLFRGKIIVNASAHTHSNILEMLNQIDRRAQKVLIAFRPIITDNKRQGAVQIPSIARFSGSSTNGKITIKKRNHQIDAESIHKEEQITLLEGKTGYLRGTTERYKNTPVFADGFFTTKPTLEKNGSGHYISAIISGDMATLQLSKKTPKSINNISSPRSIQSSTEELIVPFGTWIQIPSIDGQLSTQEIRVQRAP